MKYIIQIDLKADEDINSVGLYVGHSLNDAYNFYKLLCADNLHLPTVKKLSLIYQGDDSTFYTLDVAMGLVT